MDHADAGADIEQRGLVRCATVERGANPVDQESRRPVGAATPVASQALPRRGRITLLRDAAALSAGHG